MNVDIIQKIQVSSVSWLCLQYQLSHDCASSVKSPNYVSNVKGLLVLSLVWSISWLCVQYEVSLGCLQYQVSSSWVFQRMNKDREY